MQPDYANPQSLVSTSWLHDNLKQPDLRVVDATYFLPNQCRDAKAEYSARHIPGAVFFDIDEIADSHSPLPHMLPPSEKFASRVRKLGIGDGTRVVAYDAHGMMSAARAWWMLRIFGLREVSVLDGGLPKWIAEGRPVEDEAVQARERHFTARLDNTQLRTKQQVLRNLLLKREQVLDARSAGRFNGVEAEIWPGRRSGHIPGSLNLPFGQLLRAEDATFKSATELRELFSQSGIDLTKPIVTTCGSGITACVLALGLHLIGCRDIAVYDGSWAEWGLPGDTPVET